MMKLTAVTFLISLFACQGIHADTPANCTYEDIRGTWIFRIGDGNNDRTLNCDKFSGPYKRVANIRLLYPDLAIDDFGNKGFWTIICNQGFEVVISGRKYFAFSKYVKKTSYCHEVLPGWSHDVLGRDWACYNAEKANSERIIKTTEDKPNPLRFAHPINSEELINAINKAQKSWTAVRYDRFDELPYKDLFSMVGGRASKVQSRPKPAPVTEEQRNLMSSLPANFDWRNIDGVNFVPPVRDQAQCGSCYAFGSLGMCAARVRIQTNNIQQPVFSPQDVVECSKYSQGCAGGFPYLIGGKYAEDFGLVDEKCNPYRGIDGRCSTDPTCRKHYFTSYRYIGGYYGACNEALMMEAVHQRGPIVVGFEVYDDFRQYKSGVYHHVFTEVNRFEPFELTSHSVLVVGWGVTEEGEKYWIVQNSWGKEWGIDGYFWIRRGNDECGIESTASESDPIFTTNP